MSPEVKKVIDWLRNHIKDFLLAIAAAVIFFVMLFPFSDLSDFVTIKVAQLSQNQVYLEFDEMDIDLIPHFGLDLSNVFVETAGMPAIEMKSLVVAPSLTSLLAFKTGFSAYAEGLLDGNLDLSVQQSSNKESGLPQFDVETQLENIELKALKELVELPLDIRGGISGDSILALDPTFEVQPEAMIQLSSRPFEIRASSVPTPMGAILLPEVPLKLFELDSELTKGVLNVKKAQFGESKDPLFAQVKGDIGLKFNRIGTQVVPQFGSYNFDVDIQVQKSLAKNLGLFLSFISRFKQSTLDGGERYVFNVSGSNVRLPPRISAPKN